MTDEPRREPASAPPHADEDRQRIQWLSERSGEVELLISGALLFGLLQVPGRLEGWWTGIIWSLDQQTFIILFLLYFYVRVMVFTLIVSFSLHLVTRAYWVGLVGLDSVFPGGVDWDQVRYGPVAKRVYQDRLRSLPYLARRADDVGSAIFSVAFWIITIFVFSVVFAIVFGGLSWAISTWLLPDVAPPVILVGFAVVVGLMPLIAIGTEQVMGDRLDPDGRVAKLISGLLAAFYRVSGGALYMPIQFILFSRIPKKVVWPASIVIFVGLFSVLLVTETTRVGSVTYSASPLLPTRPGERSVSLEHFADTRSPDAIVPYIQSDVIEGPYVRLTIPLVPMRYVDRLDVVCPDLEPLGWKGLGDATATTEPPDPETESEVLDCLGRIWTVSLDGRDLDLEWDFLWAQARGVSAMVTYLPTDAIPAGAHVLRLERMPHPDDEAEDARIARYFIRFRI